MSVVIKSGMISGVIMLLLIKQVDHIGVSIIPGGCLQHVFLSNFFCRRDLGFHLVSEQVSHHPPISAFYVDGDNYSMHGSVLPKLRFWGKSVEVNPKGKLTLNLSRSVAVVSSVSVYVLPPTDCLVTRQEAND